MKKIVLISGFIVSLLFGASVMTIYAQTATPTASPSTTAVPSGAPNTGGVR